MKLTKKWLTAAASLLIAASALAAQVDVGGVKMDDTADVKGTKLVLNGAGLRYKAVFKVYAAGLYLGQKQGTAEEALAAPGAKRMQVTMLRDIDANELGKLFTRGVQDNAPKEQMSRLIPGLMRMSQIFSDQKKLVAGDVFLIDWVPAAGTLITVKGVPQGEPFKEPEFFNAMLRIWLGPQPADFKLKDALLGKGA
jgi:Chalcone isomerase-like